MIQSPSQPVTFEEFVEWKPEKRRYELHNGGIIEIAQRRENMKKLSVS
jgi:hypothetical protein